MKQVNVKKLVLLNLPYFLLGLFATNLGEAWRLATGADASAKMLSFFSTLPVALGSWWPSLHPLDFLVGLCCGAGLRLAVYLKGKNAKKYRHNVEYGSARWGTHEDIAPYIDPVFQNNVILTQTERLTMSSRPKNPKYARNKNVLVIGGSGSGKTRFWLKPNLMQMHSSYVVTDPKGTILVECGKMLQRGAPKLGKDGKPVKDKHGKIVYEPYQIKVLNTINFKKSMHYNPFSYIHSEKDILKLVTTLIANTKGEGKAGDDFWVKAETLLYCALIGYIHYEAPVEEQNFSTLIEMINSMEVREDDEEFKNAVDLMFDELKEREPNHFAVRQYVKYKLAAGKTAKSILVSCGARLAVFDIAELREVTSYDELELDTLGDRRTALMHSSYVVTDPKGTILVECGKMLQRGAPKLGKDGKPVKDKHGKIVYEPYQIKVLNTINFKKSMHYNPFSYIHSEKDILKLVTTLIANTKGEGKAGDDFWVKAETLLYCALIGYIHYEAPVEEQNFSTLIEMINSMEVREDDEEFKNAVDLMFDELKEREPNHFAVRQYVKYKLAAGKTAKSILVSCGARLAVFDIAELREVTSYDELELDTLGDRRTALFLIMSDTDDSFNFLISMCYTQLFNLLCEKADDVYGGRLPVHVRCLIDECANIGQIPKLEKLVATIRSREISACLVLQAQSQLKAIYKDNADTIIGNMDSSIFLGGKEPTTLKELEAVLGKETIDTYNTGESRGRETSHSLNYQKLGKALMSQDELAVMDGGKCILQLRGVRPFLSDKYDITQHPNYKYTADADPKNAFDIEGYLKARLKLKPNQVCDVYEIDAAAGE